MEETGEMGGKRGVVDDRGLWNRGSIGSIDVMHVSEGCRTRARCKLTAFVLINDLLFMVIHQRQRSRRLRNYRGMSSGRKRRRRFILFFHLRWECVIGGNSVYRPMAASRKGRRRLLFLTLHGRGWRRYRALVSMTACW
jgi:hypothetical protein